jgi:SAM-dependent methyltransferase
MSEIEHWDAKYNESSPPPWDTGWPSTEMKRRLSQMKLTPCSAVELGCGTGTNSIWLAQQGFDVTAIDLSPTAIEKARAKAEQAGVKVNFLQGDVTALPQMGPFSFFLDRGCYHVVRRVNLAGYIQSVARITAPKNVGLVLTGNAKEPHSPGPPVVSEEEFRSEWGPNFDIVSLEEFRFDQDPSMGINFLGWSGWLKRK